MPSFFDQCPDRRTSDSIKWNLHEQNVLPMWLADMDFKSPPAVVEALQERVLHGIFGYACEQKELKEIIVNRMSELYDWNITPDDLVFTPGVVSGFNLACQMVRTPGAELLIQPPVYPPFLRAAMNAEMVRVDSPLIHNPNGTYQLDITNFENQLSSRSALFILCNPHNPVGRVFSRNELEKMAEACLSKGTIICSDEIHCDFIFSGFEHIPIATLAPEIAMNTVTLMAPSKTYNIAGLDFAFAIIQNPELRKRYQNSCKGLTGGTNMLGQIAAKAAFQHGKAWLNECLEYLEANRDYLVQRIAVDMSSLNIAAPESTFLAWIDCRGLELSERPADFFLREGKVAFNAGEDFGPGGEGFIRFNFGCPRWMLEEGLSRMQKAIQG